MLNTSSKYILEIACFNIESCVLAQKAGADRIELCANYSLGGITPAQNDILAARKILQIPLHIIIRPRGGNFVYSVKEMETMKSDILFCKKHGIDGVVFGILNSNNSININANKELIDFAKPMSVTFHRAIDECANVDNSISDLIELGFNRVLTSGGKQNVLDGVELIALLNKKHKASITILVGGSVRSNSLNQLLQKTDCHEYHSSAIESKKINEKEIRKLKSILHV